ncbi:MAG: hypothetical protein KJP08_04425 [Gammaproteobacteria bacterium]|nr:hypothetical protein [Gammaproteobacteria bacterium]NNF50618.1 hypothetical protein [Woeseiaceae bacterium]MBT8094033.1 hypothetical protein [Gammaproteobacteria bacterium]MBT8105692.1 hypothetical protein [Gammaproteobacteria bacterium]NNK25706.1 hypothetical protein [Woeseiaceae bacterium]
MRPEIVLLALVLTAPAAGDEVSTEFGGHMKIGALAQGYPSDSVIRDVAGSDSLGTSLELRLNLAANSGSWSFDAAWQLVGLHAETLPLTGSPSDERRLFDLTDVIDDGDEHAYLHRLDRLWLGYASEKAVIRVGRQALSWGNGLAYTPMDIVNPFDPAAIDTEYKTGDDMLYLQYLQDNGNDVQAAWVARRNPVTGKAETDVATVAVKYHGFAGTREYDLLVAKSYGDPVLGLGFSRGVGGAVWGSDVVVTDTATGTELQFVTNLLYSWVWFERNMSGVLEYYYNGFGQPGKRYDPLSLAGNPALVARVARGESFTLGRHYLAANVLVEMTPLWTLTPTLLLNIEDPSAMLQLVTGYSLSDEMTLLASINVPIGARGTEFGGIESGLQNRYIAQGAGLFAQFAWYF